MTEFEFQLENFMLYCTSRNLARKTLSSYEQTLKLFGIYIDEQFNITDATSGHIRQYIKYLQERGKYTVIARAETKEVNFPHNRADYKKDISQTTIANYVRNIKVFFNWMYEIAREITKNPVEKIENPKVNENLNATLHQMRLNVLLINLM